MSFENIIGNEKIKSLLKNYVKNKNILHSYMFCGKSGIGKFLIAKEFAKATLCENSEIAPCNKCKSCIEFESNNHPDYFELISDDNSIKIDQVRFMKSKIVEKPVTSNRKVYIINDCDKMTKEAQNSLLKTLEEPPEYASIILICSNESTMLATIKSRCTKIEFQDLTEKEIITYFKSIGENIPDKILILSEGSIEKALKKMKMQDDFIELENLINNLDRISKLEVLKQDFIYNAKDNIQDILETMNNILFQIAKEKIQYLNCIKIVEKTKKDLKSNGNYNMCIDNLLLGIWEEINEKHSWSKV